MKAHQTLINVVFFLRVMFLPWWDKPVALEHINLPVCFGFPGLDLYAYQCKS
jgi:hypothetical protein